jgi:hypothetical protein
MSGALCFGRAHSPHVLTGDRCGGMGHLTRGKRFRRQRGAFQEHLAHDRVRLLRGIVRQRTRRAELDCSGEQREAKETADHV